MKKFFYWSLVTIVLGVTFSTSVLAESARAQEPKSPTILLPPIRFTNFREMAICISGNNSTQFEKTFVDAFSYWACSHYVTSVVVKNAAGWLESLAEDELIAKYQPMIIEKLRRSGKKTLDLYLFGHSNDFSAPIETLMDAVEKALGYRVKIRFVYNSGCYNFEDDGYFQENAQTYVGHKDIDYGPVYAPILLKAWFLMTPIGSAVSATNRLIDRRPFTTTEAGSLEDFWLGMLNTDAPEDNDPKGYLTGNARLTF